MKFAGIPAGRTFGCGGSCVPSGAAALTFVRLKKSIAAALYRIRESTIASLLKKKAIVKTPSIP
jgi:hypothetical protein